MTATPTTTYRVLLADDHRLVRDGLRALLSKESDLELIAEANNGREAVELAELHRPDIVIMDVGMPELNGIEAARRLRSSVPQTRILALSMHADRRFVAEMLKAGAAGYLLKESAFEDLATAIRTVLGGKPYISPAVADTLLDDYLHRKATPDRSAYDVLTPREREILQLLAEGKSMKQAAALLGLSIKTVETHRRAIMSKLNLSGIAELTKYAIREGLTTVVG